MNTTDEKVLPMIHSSNPPTSNRMPPKKMYAPLDE